MTDRWRLVIPIAKIVGVVIAARAPHERIAAMGPAQMATQQILAFVIALGLLEVEVQTRLDTRECHLINDGARFSKTTNRGCASCMRPPMPRQAPHRGSMFQDLSYAPPAIAN